MTEYSNGATGSCETCGSETAEPWHLYCPSCLPRSRDGPTRPVPSRSSELRRQHEDRTRIVFARLIEQVEDLGRRVAELERRAGG